VAVPVQRTWALLLLAAVFLMHGAPSMATDPGADGGASLAAHAAMVAPQNAVDASSEATFLGSPLVAALDAQPQEGPTSHSMATHLWTACLAVLLAGVALFAAAALRRTRPALQQRGSGGRVRGSPSSVGLPRPPDLLALCLLRT
jgi:hypothetical protein